jgi:hypothetical protein
MTCFIRTRQLLALFSFLLWLLPALRLLGLLQSAKTMTVAPFSAVPQGPHKNLN